MRRYRPPGLCLESKKQVAVLHGIHALDFPKYSPDLNPMDFFLWAEVNRRMSKQKAPRKETVATSKARMRRTAMNIPKDIIREAVLNIRKRAAAVVKADRGDILRD